MSYFKIKDHSNNDSIIFLPKEEIEDNTIEIVNNLSNCKVFNHIRVMPDCHASVNCCVGFTSEIKDRVIPNIVGGDIGCGISSYPLNKKIKKKQYKKIDQMVKEIIPLGGNVHKISIVNDVIMNNIFKECNKKLEFLKEKFPNYPYQEFNQNYYDKLIKKIDSKVNSNIFMRALGTLGGGNHYIEFNEDDHNKIYLTVHSGSRAIGQEICRYHQKKAKKESNQKLLQTYLEGDEMIEYLIDMIFAQVFASKNREIMIQLICREMGVEYKKENLIETTHNYIDFSRFILRKGAISAEENEKCLISLNMRDGILLCSGKGNREWNYSSAHGCGRIMSRGEARKLLRMKDFYKEMSEVYSSSICKETLDEAPMAYKDSEMIKKYIGDSVEILNQLKPIINIKGY
jgi:tRNA-splicing ligase RtcB (3'-phosphate/5'-hydroxy nucleic acid ligase)